MPHWRPVLRIRTTFVRIRNTAEDQVPDLHQKDSDPFEFNVDQRVCDAGLQVSVPGYRQAVLFNTVPQ